MSDDTKNYAVGYRKPPVATRFRTGRSGNPKGRPKGVKNHSTILRKLLEQYMQPMPLGWRRPRVKHILESLVERALDGEWKALRQLLLLMRVHDTTPEPYKEKPLDSTFFEAAKRFLEIAEQHRTSTEKDTEDQEDFDL
jgi:Family of unknown function (DUF5681)